MFRHCILGLLFVVAAACGKKKEQPPASPPPVPARTPTVATPPPTVDASTTPPPIPDPKNYVVVKPAFHGTVPKFPQLSGDGKSAAIDLSEALEMSEMKTFEVGFLSDAGKLEHVAVLDHDTAAKLDKDPATTVDTAAIEKSASAVAKRLADGRFSAFATKINSGALEAVGDEARAKGTELPVSIGDAKLVATVVLNKSGPTSLKLRLDNAAGKKVTEQLVPGVVSVPGHPDCTAAPRLGNVWFDTARKRMLLEMVFMTAGACPETQTYQLWKLP